MARDDLADWLQSHRSSLETRAAGIDAPPGSTILPTLGVESGQIELARQLLESRDEVVQLEQTLGEGGMGIVRLGTQTSLDRQVAVKSVKSTRFTAAAVAKLVQEAWVTGFLEHPNIVPVYDLARDETGNPLLVMKRIEGVPWGDLIEDADAVREQFGAEDLLEWNLRVLMAVANALHYAHSRGILHLDLKPDNVMIGTFGEVYLVDWGLALSLRPQEHRLPAAAANTEIIGTPAFVAPEMLTSEGERLGPRTDVYLLGSALYAVLAGHPPHQGDTVMAVLFKALQGQRAALDEAPAELVAIVDAAMQLEPEDRLESAEAFRLRVQGFLQHRGSSRLVATATEHLEQLESLVSQRGDDVVALAGAAGAAARFGFAQALDAWPGNEAAQAGYDRATTLIAIECARRGESTTAKALLATVVAVPEDLDATLEEAWGEARAEAARVRELRAMELQLDARTGQRTRLFVTGILVVAWTVLPLVGIRWPETQTWGSMYGLPMTSLGLLIALTTWARESLLATQVNRRGMAGIAFMLSFQILLTWSAQDKGMTIAETLALVSVLWALTSVFFSLTIERRLWPSTIGYSLAAILCTVAPQWRLELVGLSNVGLFLNALVVWNPNLSVAPKDVQTP